MKARVIATGKIVEVVANENYYDTTDNKERYYSYELDFNDTTDYWTRLEHIYIGMAMQGILANSEFDEVSVADIAITSIKVATSVIKRLKEERK